MMDRVKFSIQICLPPVASLLAISFILIYLYSTLFIQKKHLKMPKGLLTVQYETIDNCMNTNGLIFI